jgi:hypothetical protein
MIGRKDPGAAFHGTDTKPFYTVVIGGNKSNEWGFYPEPGEFVHHKDFLNADQ